MIFGVSVQTFTIVHVIISFVAILSGIVAMIGMLASRRLGGWTALFLLTTVLTSVTGFMFPITGFTPALGTGIASLVVLAIALVAIYGRKLTGPWRWIYVVTGMIALWFNVLVLIVQAFQKIAFLHALAPTQSEPPFLIAQGVALILFVVWAIAAAIRFHPERVAIA
jgi:hypothetical protein